MPKKLHARPLSQGLDHILNYVHIHTEVATLGSVDQHISVYT